MSKINGFIVVRKPQHNAEIDQRACQHLSIRYCGLDRMRWADLGDAFHSGSLSAASVADYKALLAENRDLTGIPTAKSPLLAGRLMASSEELNPSANELIVVFSDLLVPIKGSIEHDKRAIDWMGYDVVSLGNWSLIAAALFAPPQFQTWTSRLNEFGLLTDPKDAHQLETTYQELAERGMVEQLPGSPYGVDTIHVGLRKNPTALCPR